MYFHRGTAEKCHWHYPGLSSFTILSVSSISNPEITPVLPYIGKDSMRKRVKLLDKELEETAKKTGSVRGNLSRLQTYFIP